MKYRQFIFKNWSFEPTGKVLVLHYSFDDQINFTESFKFDFDFVDNFNQQLLEKYCQTLFLIAGVSYYKRYMPPEIVLGDTPIDKEIADFLSRTYQKGLGEFFYVNHLDPKTPVTFRANVDSIAKVEAIVPKGLLIGIGGGKDALVSTELLRQQPRVATWGLNQRSQLQPLVDKIGLPHFWVERNMDPQLTALNSQGAYNGHVPFSAIVASVGCIVAVLSGYSEVVVSNESSASEPSLVYRGAAINHQYSKSIEFEKDFQQYLHHISDDSVHYYSFLRPLTDLRIAELFAHYGFEKYKDSFISCNRALSPSTKFKTWCGQCPKCAFTFLALTPFLTREQVENIWGGKNLLLDPALEPTYKALLGISGDKPLDCVGEVKESRAAMRLAQKQYPELMKYKFNLPKDYDYKQLSPHSMPAYLYDLLVSKLEF